MLQCPAPAILSSGKGIQVLLFVSADELRSVHPRRGIVLAAASSDDTPGNTLSPLQIDAVDTRVSEFPTNLLGYLLIDICIIPDRSQEPAASPQTRPRLIGLLT